jgi:WD40 repeat protein/DNA-binding SARP family transcriptional activator
MVDFRVLGGLVVARDQEEVTIGGPRQRRLLAMLLIHANRVVSVDRLADVVFDGEPTAAAATTLRSYVSRIRRVVEEDGVPPRLVTRAPGYSLRLDPSEFDVTRFEQAVARARRSLDGGDAAGAAAESRAALGLWRGDAYAEFAYEDWALPEAQRLGELRLVAAEVTFDADLACGRAADVIPEVEALVREHPFREGFCSRYMTALYRSGRQADALRAFSEHRSVLAEELGLDPSPALVELERQILAHDPALQTAAHDGRVLRGYRLGERLGTGRDGTVHAATLPSMGREFAIKSYRGDIADAPDAVRAFEATACRLASLHHPAIVPIHDYWREPGAAYLVMHRTHGGTLTDRLERGPLSPEDLSRLVSRLGSALAAGAEVGVGHDRLTADNVLFDDHGEPGLSDFDLMRSTTPTTAWDIEGFVALIRRCSGETNGALAAVLDDGLATVGRPSITEFTHAVIRALDGVDLAVGPAANPYKGLQAFDEVDAVDFFGRTDVIDDILARLGGDGLRSRLVLLVGGSGTGKSSVVRAGLLPRIRRGDVTGSSAWFVTTMLPGTSPFKELAEALSQVAVDGAGCNVDELAVVGGLDRVLRRLLPSGGQLLLVVDQLEELFTMSAERDRNSFLDALLDAVQASGSRLRVVATLRADFFDRPLALPAFGAVVNGATVTISPMQPGDLEAAIVEPAERVGRAVERPLVAELVAAVANDAAPLPSLQFTLHELADRCPGTLTLVAYRELGGVNGAIAARAEQLYRSLKDTEQAAARALFERLVVLGPSGEPTRRRAVLDELGGIATEMMLDVITVQWTEARLLTVDADPHSRLPTVELAHEALLTQWPRLRGWIDEDRFALASLGQLRSAAAEWAELGRDTGALYRGARLEGVVDLGPQRLDRLSALEREFVDASGRQRDRESEETEAQIRSQARANRRLRIQLAVVAVALVAALAGGLVAIGQRRNADHARRVAAARELAAGSGASVSVDPDRSILLALEAIDVSRGISDGPVPEAVDALHRAVTASRLVLSVPGIGGAVDWSPDGKLFVTEGPEESGIVDLRDADTGASVRSFKGHDIDINDVAFSTDGSMVATTGDDGALRVWSTSSGDLVAEFVFEGGVWGPSFSGDDRTVSASWIDRSLVRVFDLETATETRTVDASSTVSTSLDGDGGRVLIASNIEGLATVVDVATGSVDFTIGHDEGWINDADFSPDGRWIATAGGDSIARIWDAATGELRSVAAGHTGAVEFVDWSPDSTRLATGSVDGTAKVWNLTDEYAVEVATFSALGTRNGAVDVAFSADGSRLLTGDLAVTSALIWELGPRGGAEWANIGSIPFNPNRVQFTSSGLIVSTEEGGVVTLSDPRTGAVRRRIATLALPEPGPQPTDPVQAEQEVANAFETLYGSEPFQENLDLVDDPTGIAAAAEEAIAANPGFDFGSLHGTVTDLVFTTPTEAWFTYSVNEGDQTVLEAFGTAALQDGSWRISRPVVCADLALLGGDCGQFEPIDAPRMGEVVHVAVAAGADLMATSVGQLPVDVWDLSTGRRVARAVPDYREMSVLDLAMTVDGSHVAIAEGDGEGSWVVVVDGHGTEVARLTMEPEVYVRSVDFSPDGCTVAVARRPSRGDAVELEGTDLWSWCDDELVGRTNSDATAAIFDPSGNRLVTTHGEIAEVWSAATGELLSTVNGSAPIEGIAIDPDGSLMATANSDATVELWDPNTGVRIGTLAGHDTAVNSVAFGPDGTELASLGYDGVVRVWALKLDDLVTIAESRLTRSLTDDECRQYLHSDGCRSR